MSNLSTSIKMVLKDFSALAGGFGVSKMLDVNLVFSLLGAMLLVYLAIPLVRVGLCLLRDILLDRLSNRLSDSSKKHLEKHRLREDVIANNAITPPEPPKDEPKKDEKPPEEKSSDSKDAPSE